MATKKTIITRDKIVSMYINYRLENNDQPKSVYQFSKINGFDESQFYSFFGTLESVEKEIYKVFLEKTVELIQKDPAYESYDMKSKMLSFYFTFFELLSANRSYVVMSLKEHQNQLILIYIQDLYMVRMMCSHQLFEFHSYNNYYYYYE